MKADELDIPQGEAVKFKTMGDKVQGTVTYVGDWVTRINNFGQEQTSVKIVLDTSAGAIAIYPNKGSTMAQAIGQAIKKAGASSLAAGGTLGVKFTGEKDVNKGNPLKLFAAVYEAPKNVGGATFDEDEPF